MMKKSQFVSSVFLFLVIGICFPLMAQWEEVTQMPVALSGVSAINFRGKIYLIGGKNLNTYYDRVDVYDPQTNNWDTSSTARLNYARSNAAIVEYNNRIFVIGGRDKKGALRMVEAFDPDSNRWVELDAIKGPRDGAVAQVLNDSLLVIGGTDNEGTYIEKIEYYNEEEDNWQNSGLALSPSRAGGLSVVRGDTVWIFGGFYFSPLSSSMKFILPGIWTSGPELGLARGEGAAVILGDSILLIGGESPAGAVSLVELYNIDSGRIEPGPDLPDARAGHAAAVSGHKAYVFGGHGESPNNVLQSVLSFEFLNTAVVSGPAVPLEFDLTTYPNPFNGGVSIKFDLTKPSRINLTVYDGQGRSVRELINRDLNRGVHFYYWDGMADGSKSLASGIYYLCLRSRSSVVTRKLIYLR